SSGVPVATARTTSAPIRVPRTALVVWRRGRMRTWRRTTHPRAAAAAPRAETPATTIGATTVIAAAGAGSVRPPGGQGATPATAGATAATNRPPRPSPGRTIRGACRVLTAILNRAEAATTQTGRNSPARATGLQAAIAPRK